MGALLTAYNNLSFSVIAVPKTSFEEAEGGEFSH
jgi:hypothetical protein